MFTVIHSWSSFLDTDASATVGTISDGYEGKDSSVIRKVWTWQQSEPLHLQHAEGANLSDLADVFSRLAQDAADLDTHQPQLFHQLAWLTAQP